MVMVLAGDFDPKEAVQLVEKYFGNYKRKLTLPTFEEQKPVQGPIIRRFLVEKKSEFKWRAVT